MALLDFPSGPGTGDTYTLNGNMWKWNGTSWVAFNSLSLSSQVSGILAVQYGGTGFGGTYAIGDILYASASNAFTKLSAGTAGSVLASGGTGAAPYWKVDDSGTGSVGNGTSGGFAYYNGLNTITSGTAFSYINGSGAGGTGATVVLTQSSLSLIGSTITSGTWAGSAITAKYGGTGLNALSAGDLIYGSAADTYSRLTHSGSAGSILVTVGSSGIAWTLGSSLTVGTATSAATINTEASTATRYLIGTALNTASGNTQLSTGSGITIGNNLLTSAGIAVTGTTVSTSTTSGALIVSGGVGVGLTSYFGQSVVIQGSTASGSTSTGALTVSGGVGIGGSLSVGSQIFVNNAFGSITTLQSSIFNKAAGANATSLMQVKGNDGTTGLGLRATTGSNSIIYSNGAIDFKVGSTVRDNDVESGGTTFLSLSTVGVLTASGATASTSTSTGAVVVTGGVGIGGSLWTATANFSSISGVGHQNGAITSGVWSGTAISLANGGTNANLTASAGAIVYSTSTAFALSAVGTAGSILQSANTGAPIWVGQSSLSVGTATSAALVVTDAVTATRYLVGTVLNTASTGGTLLSTGSGITIGNNVLTATTFQGSLSGTASTSTTAVNVNTYALSGTMYLTGQASSSGAGSGASQLVGSGISFNSTSGLLTATSYAGSGNQLSGIVTSLAASTGISVNSATGAVTVTNTGVISLTGTANQVLVAGGSGSATSGNITLTLPQSIGTGSTVSFADLNLTTGSNSTLTTVGSQPTSMINKQYVDNLASGLDIHGSVRAIAASGLGASYIQSSIGGSTDATGAYLISTSQVALSVDGVTFVATGATQRVLVAGGIDGKVNIGGTGFQASTGISYLANGIYFVTAVGSGSSNWILTRATDTDTNTELTAGTFTFVEEGASYADTGWVCTNDTTNLGPIGFGITQISFTQFTGGGALTMGQGLFKSGNNIATKVNLSSTGAASGTGFTQFNIGGASGGGVADTGYYPTFSVRTSGTVAGTAVLQLNSDGFSLIGSTNTPRTITVTGGDITLNGGSNNTLTLTGNISLPSPQQYRLAYGLSGTAISFLPVGGASSVLFQTNSTSDPTWVGQSTLVVGGATTAANIQAGGAGSIVYNTSASTTTFLNHSGTAGSILVTTASSGLAWTVGSSLTVGTATSAVTINTEASTATRYLIGTALNTASGNTQLSTGSGITIGNNLLTSAGISVTGSTASTSTTTGALIVSGGVGIGGSLWTATTNFSSISGVGHSNSVITSGVWSGTAISLANGGTNANLTASAGAVVYSTTTALALSAVGTAGSILQSANTGAPIWVGQSTLSVGTATSAAQVNIASSTAARYLIGVNSNSSANSAQLSTGSGVSVADNLLIAGAIGVTSSTASTSTSTGALTVSGGVGIGGSLWTASGNLSSVSGVSLQSGAITGGTWAGTAVSLLYGGTNNTTSGNGYSSKVAVYNAAGTAITALTHTQGSVIFGATGGTYAAIGSTLMPVAFISDTAPAQPGGAIGATQAGQLWWDSYYGVLKVYYADGTSNQWVDATPVLGSSGGGSSTKRSYVMTFGAGFTPSTGADTVQILIPYAPDNTSKYYYIKRLDYRANTAGTGVSFYIERFTGGNAAFDVGTGNRIHSASGASFVAASGLFITSYTQSSSGASFVSSSGIAGSILSGDYLRLNFSHINSAANMSISIIIEEQ